jgi:predicted RNase H-like nuclease
MSADLVTFIGIDLAWSRKNPTGAAIVRGDAHGGELIDTALLGGDDEIVDYTSAAAGAGPAIVAIDAPLVVPNTSGRRPGEHELGKIFAKHQAGAHPANRGLAVFRQGVRGEELVQRLEIHGFKHQATIDAGVKIRQVIEVYPHAAMVALFELDRTLKYKAKPQRSIEARHAAWGEYQRYLNELAECDPPLRGQAQLTGLDVASLRGRRLKDYEDRVDALMCAYIALYAFRWGMARCRVFGALEEGYIFTPVPRYTCEE